jgi:glycerol-3-phosphate dehydrogenase
MRGLSVMLVEHDDLAQGTTSRSTRLTHGGLRYLAQREFGLVRENLRERAILLRIAPHLVHPLAVHVPLYRVGVRRRTMLRAGMMLYDLLSRRTTMPRCRWIGRERMLALESGLAADGLRGAWRFYDAQCELVERLGVENVVEARSHGAAVLTHARVARWLREDGAVVGAEVEHRGRTMPIRAGETVNATGAWLDQLGPHARPLLGLTKGVHLVAPPATRHAFLLIVSDDRPVFVLPWLGSSLVGTTDTDYAGDPSDARATDEDVAYLVPSAGEAFPQASFDDVAYMFAGIRALERVGGVSEGEVPRENEIRDHTAKDGVGGIVSVVGGKLTAYRGIAQEAVDLVAARLGARARCTTAAMPLPGAADAGAIVESHADYAARLGLEPDQLERLARVYGVPVRRLLARIERYRSLAERLAPSSAATRVAVVHAVEEECAATLSDVLLRRTCLGLARDRALPLARAAAETLGWGTGEAAAYADEVRGHAPARERARSGYGGGR